MGLKSQTREIGGRKYEVVELPTDEGLPLFFALGKLVGPSIAELLRRWQAETITQDAAAEALTELVAALKWDDLQRFTDAFAKSTYVLGRDNEGAATRTQLSKIWALAFAGDYLSLCKWLGFAIEVNFASFFVGLGVTKLPSSAAAQ